MRTEQETQKTGGINKSVDVKINVVPYMALDIQISLNIATEVVEETFTKEITLRYRIENGSAIFVDENENVVATVPLTEFANYVEEFVKKAVEELEREASDYITLFQQFDALKANGFDIVVVE
ncbi:hypothetical protein [Pyrobaculum sp.]|uniref:hypothetical protein n=1 Tax=Pyrobaculum sp. TaxID=2004705 RepID=UPI003D0BCBFF